MENDPTVNSRRDRFAIDIAKSFAVSAAAMAGAVCGLVVGAIIVDTIFGGRVKVDTPVPTPTV